MFLQMQYESNDVGLVPDCSNSRALAMELLQSCINSLRPSDAYMRR